MSSPAKNFKKKGEATSSLEDLIEMNEARTRALKKLLKLFEEERKKANDSEKNKSNEN